MFLEPDWKSFTSSILWRMQNYSSARSIHIYMIDMWVEECRRTFLGECTKMFCSMQSTVRLWIGDLIIYARIVDELLGSLNSFLTIYCKRNFKCRRKSAHSTNPRWNGVGELQTWTDIKWTWKHIIQKYELPDDSRPTVLVSALF